MIYLKWVLKLFLFQTVLGLYVPKQTSTIFKEINEDIGEPLFLTSLLEEGKYKEAQKLSYVQTMIGNVTSYSGYFTVNKECESNLFFWFFLAEKENWEELPLVLWLQGGPGFTSMFGLFQEIGPFQVEESDLKKRQYSWTTEQNVIFIDQPVGTGFSFTGKNCYPDNDSDVGRDLYQAIVQFHMLFPNFQNNRFFISGESYAGHFIPALGHAIHMKNPSAKLKINLTAMLIGNGLYDAAKQSDYASYLYQLGLIDNKQKELLEEQQNRLLKALEDGNSFDDSLILVHVTDLVRKFIGDRVKLYNYLAIANPPMTEMLYWEGFVKSATVRKALHVGNHEFNISSSRITIKLLSEFTKSMQPWIEELVEHYPIIFYNGQLDIICAYPMSVNFINSLDWSGQPQYLNATRSKWCVGQEQAGYFKGEHHLYEVLVRGAGHMVPIDKPQWAYELVNSITSGSPDNPLHALKTCD